MKGNGRLELGAVGRGETHQCTALEGAAAPAWAHGCCGQAGGRAGGPNGE